MTFNSFQNWNWPSREKESAITADIHRNVPQIQKKNIPDASIAEDLSHV